MIGIAVAATSNGQRFANSQAGFMAIVTANTIGKLTEAIIEASEIYRHNKTAVTHTTTANDAQAV